MQWFKAAMSEADGAPSAKRVIGAISLLFGIGFCITALILSYLNPQFEIGTPLKEITITIVIFGIGQFPATRAVEAWEEKDKK